MKNQVKSIFNKSYLLLSIGILSISCTSDSNEVLEELSLNTIKEETILQAKVNHTDAAIAARFAPIFYQDVDTTEGICSNQSKTGSADWITAVDYDGDWITGNNWDNMVSGRDSGKLIPYVYYYVTYTETHFFILYSV